jgi:hypothetical protein
VSVRDLLARPKSGRTYPEHAGRAARAQSAPAPAPKRFALAECVHLGARTGKGCGSLVRACHLHGTTTTAHTRCPDAVRHCPACPDRVSVGTAAARPDPAAGVVIGSYKWPELIDLQVRAIRATCGPVPVFVSGDRPEDRAALESVAASHGDVTVDVNAERIGHLGGDLAAYFKGIRWAASRGLSVLAKLSQRFVALRPYWLQEGGAALLASGLPVSTRHHTGHQPFPLRTEAMLLDVAAWNRPDVLARIEPRRYWTGTGVYAENLLADLLARELGGRYLPWPLLTADRYQRAPEVLWHHSDTAASYRAIAARFGVELPADFTVAGWEAELRAGVYSYG